MPSELLTKTLWGLGSKGVDIGLGLGEDVNFKARPCTESIELSERLLCQFTCWRNYQRSEPWSLWSLEAIKKENNDVTNTHNYNQFTLRWARIGTIKAAVFPEPVGAHATNSLPWKEQHALIKPGWQLLHYMYGNTDATLEVCSIHA